MFLVSKKLLILSVKLSLIVTSCSSLAYIWEDPPLAIAAQNGDVDRMEKLIAQGENIHEIIGQEMFHAGSPILRYAIDSGCLAAVSLLLEHGADSNGITESPLIIDDECKRANVRNLSLLSHAVNSHAPICIIKELIKYGANVDGKPKILGDWSALMIAAYRGYKEALVLLIEQGAEVFTRNRMDGKHALDYAREMNHTEIVKILEAFYTKNLAY